jgi:signal transduction histidine kinase
MDWSSWVFLGLGLGLGISIGRNSGLSRSAAVQPSAESTAASSAADCETRLLELRSEVEQLKLESRLAQTIADFKGGFLARIAHELKSPLNSIIGSQQIILADLCNDAEEEREFLENANNSTLKMVELLEEILLVSKIERGKLPLRRVPLSVTQLLQEVRSLTYIQAADRNFPLRILPPEPDVQIFGDLKLLRQILVFLIETAISNMDEGSIHLSARAEPTAELVQIWLDSPCPIDTWNDPVDFLRSESPANPRTDKSALARSNQVPKLSSGLNLLSNQMLLAMMEGTLEVLEVPDDGDPLHVTRVQCSLPRLDAIAPMS